MSEHKEFLPPSPSSPRSLTEENLEKHQLHLDTTDLPTPPTPPAIKKNATPVTCLLYTSDAADERIV